MFRSILSRLPLVEWGDSSDEGGDSESGFRPSRLDASVLYAHGADVEALEEEIADAEKRARTLEDARSGE